MRDRIALYLEVRHPQQLLKKLIQQKINLYSIEIGDSFLEVIIPYRDYELLKKMKTIQKIKIVNYYGIPKIWYLFHHFSYVLFFLFFSLFFLFILSSFIFRVEVLSPNQNLNKIVKNDLKKLGIAPYHFKVSFQKKEKIKEKLLELEKNQIEWLEIEEHGTKYIVKVEEKKIKTSEENCVARHVVSLKDAMITRVEAIRGEVVKRKNDYVSKGDVIISGEIHNGEDLVSLTCSEGDVYGEVWYRVKISIPTTYENYQKTKNYHYGLFFVWRRIPYHFSKYSYYEALEYPIVSSSLLSMKFGFAKYQKVIKNTKYYEFSNVDGIAYQKAELKLNESLKLKAKVLRKKILKKEVKDSKIIVEVFFAVEEKISDYQMIQEKE